MEREVELYLTVNLLRLRDSGVWDEALLGYRDGFIDGYNLLTYREAPFPLLDQIDCYYVMWGEGFVTGMEIARNYFN